MKTININSDAFRGGEIEKIPDQNFLIFIVGGSTVFGIFENPEIAKKALARFTGKKYRVCLAKSITRFSEFFPEEMISAF